MEEQEEHNAKLELLRLDNHLIEKVLLVGGLAVQQYIGGRASKDLDLVCSQKQQKFLQKHAYPSECYEEDFAQNDLRPDIVYTHVISRAKIYLGSKIRERTPYPFIIYDDYFENSQPYVYDNKRCENVYVPSVNDLAFMKLVSFLGRRDSQKGLQDLKDFCDLTNHRSFVLNRFLGTITKSDATSHIRSSLTDIPPTEKEAAILARSGLYRVQSILPLLKSEDSHFQSLPEFEQQNADITKQIGVEIIDQFSAVSIVEIVKGAKKRLKFFTMSGRNIISPRVKAQIEQVIQNGDSDLKVQMLCLNKFSKHDYIKERKRMMHNTEPFPGYSSDFDRSRVTTREITSADPEHNTFDIRFYDMLPTTFFIICDNTIYVSFQLSTPVAFCPVIRIDGSIHTHTLKVFLDHFEHYWSQSLSFVCVLGVARDTGNFLLVKNRRRGKWGWPAGFVEPNETILETAQREFLEETGHAIKDLELAGKTTSGVYFAGFIGDHVSEYDTREVEEIGWFRDFPESNQMAFPEELEFFKSIVAELRSK